MNSAAADRDPFDLLAEEFAVRVRRGEHPSLSEYAALHPELAVEIRRVFPSIVMLERLKRESSESGFTQAGQAARAMPERLGDYRILREVGRGGMGVVYEAEQESLGRRVAVKVLSPRALFDPRQLGRFEREARATARLHHTNIVPVFGVGEHEGTAYYVMQFIPGVGLDLVLDDLRRIRLGAPADSRGKRSSQYLWRPIPPEQSPPQNGFALTATDVAQSLVSGEFVVEGRGEHRAAHDATRAGDADSPPIRVRDRFSASSGSVFGAGSSQLSALSPTDRRFYFGVARIGIQVAEALEYANGLGVLHRDIKPSNLLLDPLGNVWVTDFGLAKIAETEELTLPGDVVGTIRYMAPERFRGKCDARSDIYSLGLTLYELVSTKPAFEASDRHELIRKVMHENPAPLKRLAHSVPSDLETIINKAIARARRAISDGQGSRRRFAAVRRAPADSGPAHLTR